jgi:predicted anti-sigma-YlaC factor YlaD
VSPRLPTRWLTLLVALAALVALPACSIRKFATKSVANSLTSGPDVYATDDDPELVREAIPFGLKTIEGLLATLPNHEGLLLSACRGFTQYAVGFVAADADLLPPEKFEEQEALHARALRLCLRARDYGLRGLELKHKGLTARLQSDPGAAKEITVKELPMLFWTAAAWGSAISLGKDHPELMADVSVVRALFARGLELNESYEAGMFHEAMIPLEALPTAMGGSLDRARQHFARARELSKDGRASVFVTQAENVSIQTQNRAEFQKLLDQALAVDPNRDSLQRMPTLVSQRKARGLLLRMNDLFLDAPDTTSQESHP